MRRLVTAAITLITLHVASGKLVMQRDSTPEGFALGAAAKPSASISFDLFLRQPEEARLMEIATAVSDPDHTDYGKHMTPDEVKALMQPSADDVAVVENWIHSAGGKTHQASVSYVCAQYTLCLRVRGSERESPETNTFLTTFSMPHLD